MKYLKSLLFFFVIVVYAGCKKHADDFTLVNNTARRVLFDLYGSARDYSLGENCLVSGYIESKQKVVIPGAKVNNQFFYIDWHSEDQAYSNWLFDNGAVSWKGHTGTLEEVPLFYTWKICFGSGRSRWRLIGGDNYNLLSNYEKSLEIVINKRSVEFYHTDTFGNIHERTSPEISRNPGTDIYISSSEGLNLDGSMPSVASAMTKSSSDTIVYVINGYYYLMVREK